MNLCLPQNPLSFKLLARGNGQLVLPIPRCVEELLQDDNLLVSTKTLSCVCGTVCFCECFDSFPPVAKLWQSQGVKWSIEIFLLSTPKQNKFLLHAGCSSFFSCSAHAVGSRLRTLPLCKSRVVMMGGDAWLSSRDALWWESQLLALAACPWASALLAATRACALAYLLQSPERFHSCP